MLSDVLSDMFFDTVDGPGEYILKCDGSPVLVDTSLQGTRVHMVSVKEASRFTREDAIRIVRLHSLPGEEWDICYSPPAE